MHTYFAFPQLWIYGDIFESLSQKVSLKRFQTDDLIFQALIKHLEDEDVEAFTTEVKNFDQISRLDQWFTTILLRIKKQMPDDNELC